MRKTHFAIRPPYDSSETSACGRGKEVYMTSDAFGVTCIPCQNRDEFILAKDEAELERHKAFMAKEPRVYREPWGALDNITCRICNGDKFRIGPRGLYGHYENYHCAECGHVESRLTEKGMSF